MIDYDIMSAYWYHFFPLSFHWFGNKGYMIKIKIKDQSLHRGEQVVNVIQTNI